jgi:hypothetical protein
VDVEVQSQRIIVEASEAGVFILDTLDEKHVRIVSVETRYKYPTLHNDRPVSAKVDKERPSPSKSDKEHPAPPKSDLGMCTRTL